MHAHRTLALLILLMSAAAGSLAAERHWQTGTWGDVTTKRKLIDFGPGASPFGRAGAQPSMRAMATSAIRHRDRRAPDRDGGHGADRPALRSIRSSERP